MEEQTLTTYKRFNQHKSWGNLTWVWPAWVCAVVKTHMHFIHYAKTKDYSLSFSFVIVVYYACELLPIYYYVKDTGIYQVCEISLFWIK